MVVTCSSMRRAVWLSVSIALGCGGGEFAVSSGGTAGMGGASAGAMGGRAGGGGNAGGGTAGTSGSNTTGGTFAAGGAGAAGAGGAPRGGANGFAGCNDLSDPVAFPICPREAPPAPSGGPIPAGVYELRAIYGETTCPNLGAALVLTVTGNGTYSASLLMLDLGITPTRRYRSRWAWSTTEELLLQTPLCSPPGVTYASAQHSYSVSSGPDGVELVLSDAGVGQRWTLVEAASSSEVP
jgi:hypothetical protein